MAGKGSFQKLITMWERKILPGNGKGTYKWGGLKNVRKELRMGGSSISLKLFIKFPTEGLVLNDNNKIQI